ncbi:hypothetical protein SORBI_3007G080780 [Sorghum bicolor]|uniref:Uncharacterized protein n=1 Tax=Sorghum bicolor TaxID=4558 RepID=A0A1Z5R8L6_SORBI|nr:hypothetical protein SORBI_3007G080780 [Sorghum bicolor]
MHPRSNPLPILLTIIGTILFITGGAGGQPHGGSGVCITTERAALLSFKKGITSDPANLLASWRGQDCCQWRGIRCNNKTGHVTKLQLRNPNPYMSALSGEISPSLLSLEYLEHMDLSSNSLTGPHGCIPQFLGSMKNMKYLNLSGIPFTGGVAPQLGNLSNLQYLDLGRQYYLYSADITWLTNLPLLQYLDMSYVNLSGIADWPQKLNMVPSLRVIRLTSCSLDTTNQSLSHFNLTNLEKLDLSLNNFNHPIVSSWWFWKPTGLKYLNLHNIGLIGHLQDSLENMTLLRVLDLSNNYQNCLALTGSPSNLCTFEMIGNLNNLCSLEILDLSYNYMSGDMTIFTGRLPQCSWDKLQHLNLDSNNLTGTLPNLIGHFISLSVLVISNNNLTGTIPAGLGNCTHLTILDLYCNKISGSVPTEIGSLSKLTSLDLRNNNLSGGVPTQIGGCSNLTFLDVSNNYLSGVIMEEHFEGLISLKKLDLSSNKNLKVTVNRDWFPPFRLEYGNFANCQMAPLFPAWLQQQFQISHLDMSSTYLKDKIPEWFWLTFSQAIYIDISDNKLSGSLPAHLDGMAILELNLSSNLLTGPVPSLPRSIITLDISNNLFSGKLPLNFGAPTLATLIMFSNQIGGSIPESMCKLQGLFDLDLSSNLLEGEVPECFPTESLQFLVLSNNSFSGIFPSFLQNCITLLFLDLAWNQFSGTLPASIGTMTNLHFLRLSHNTFSGNVPPEITHLSCLQFLDLSANNLSGVIPWHLSNLTGMTLKSYQDLTTGDVIVTQSGNIIEITVASQFEEEWSIITKGQKLRYGRGLQYFVSIDFSGNFLTGEIPSEITSLCSLINLNLSSNQLSGKIPNNIGIVHSLESLDLSENKLSGEIPSSLSSLASLSYLNLSYNNLAGTIPSGRQLDTLSADNPSLMYIGNSGLCGPPLKRNCSTNDSSIHTNHRSNRKEFEPMSFPFGLGLGLVVGLWTVFCALLFKKTWRIAYFQLFDKLCDRIYVFVAVKWASLTKIDED